MKKPTYEFSDFIAKIFDIKEKSAKTITFQVTEDCCLHCSYCYQINKAKNKMTFDTAKTFINYLFEHRLDDSFDFSEVNAPGLIIEFIGGEPLLEVHLIH
jgi:sulfatase maturation enzyme AslB (radical SAM superfamily)